MPDKEIQHARRHLVFNVVLFLTPLLAGGNFPASLGGPVLGQFFWSLLVLLAWAWITISKPAGFRELLLHKPLWPLWAFIIWLFLTTPLAQVLNSALQGLIIWFTVFLLALAGLQLRLNYRQILVSLGVLLSSASLAAAYGIHQTLWSIPVLVETPGLNADEILLLSETLRSFSLFPGPNIFGGFLLPFVPICVLLLREASGIRKRVPVLLAFVLILVALFFSQSRGAWLIFGIGLLPTTAMLANRRGRILLLIVFSMLFIAFYFYSNLQSNVDPERRQESITERAATIVDPENISSRARTDYWITAWDMGLDYPIFGSGLENFGELARKYQPNANYTRYPHNFALRILAELGFPGLLMFLAILLSAAFAVWKGRDSEFGLSGMVLLATAALMTWLHGLIDFDFSSPAIHAGFLLCLVFIWSPGLPAIRKKGETSDSTFRILLATFVLLAVFFSLFFSIISKKYGEQANRARLHNQQAKAMELAQRAVAFWTMDPFSHYRLSQLHLGSYQISKNPVDLQKARAHIKTAIDGHPANPDFFLGLADVLALENNLEQALVQVKRAADLYPTSIFYQHRYAETLARSGNLAAALHTVNQALLHEEDYLLHAIPNGMDLVRARYFRASLLIEQKQYLDAMEEYQNILRLLDRPTLLIRKYSSIHPGQVDKKQIREKTLSHIDRLGDLLAKEEEKTKEEESAPDQ